MIPNTETNGFFFLRDGFFFRRNEDGTVTILYAPLDPTAKLPAVYRTVAETTVPDTEFASVMATVSTRGETRETWQEAVDYLGDTKDDLSLHNSTLEDRMVAVLADLRKIGPSTQPGYEFGVRDAEDHVAEALRLLRIYVLGIVL